MLKVKYSPGSVGLSVALLTLLLYLRTVYFDFVQWDDPKYLADNTWFAMKGRDFFWTGLTGSFEGNWHPLTMFSYAFDNYVWGMKPFGFHLTNVVLHTACTYLVFIFSLKVFKLHWKNEDDSLKTVMASAFTALIFGLHPLHVESVVWVSERKDVLCAFFYMLGLILYLEYVAVEGAAKRKNYFLLIVVFVLALMSKSMAISFPLVMLILDFYPLERFKKPSDAYILIKEKLPFFVVTIVATVIAFKTQKPLIGSADFGFSVTERILNAGYWYIKYLLNMVFPYKLWPMYIFPADISVVSAKHSLSVLALVAFTAYILIKKEKMKALAAVWAAYVIMLMPVIGIVKIGLMAAADRYMYLPSIAPSMILCGLFAAFYERLKTRGRRLGLLAVFLAIFVVMAGKTVVQQNIWRNSMSLWSAAVDFLKETPGVYKFGFETAFYVRGLEYFKKGKYAEAVSDFSFEIKLFPENIKSYRLRGKSYFLLKRYNEAILDLDYVIKSDVPDWENYLTRGLSYAYLGKAAEAEKDFKEALRLASSRTEPYENLGFLYKENNRPALQKYYFSLAERVYNGGKVSDEELRRIMSRSEF